MMINVKWLLIIVIGVAMVGGCGYKGYSMYEFHNAQHLTADKNMGAIEQWSKGVMAKFEAQKKELESVKKQLEAKKAEK